MIDDGDAMTGVLLVTGGSRGIGAATAILGAAQGYAVCVNYTRNADAALRSLMGSIRGCNLNFATRVASFKPVCPSWL